MANEKSTTDVVTDKKLTINETVKKIVEEALGHPPYVARAAKLESYPVTAYQQIFPMQDEKLADAALTDIVLCTDYHGPEKALKDVLMRACEAIEEYGPVIKLAVHSSNVIIEFGKSTKTFALEPGLDLVGILLDLEHRAYLNADARSRVKVLAEREQYQKISDNQKVERKGFFDGWDFIVPSFDYCGSVRIHINNNVPYFKELDSALRSLMARSPETSNNFNVGYISTATNGYHFYTNEYGYQGLITALDLIRTFGDLLLLKAAIEKRYPEYLIKIVGKTSSFDIEVYEKSKDGKDDLLRVISWSQKPTDDDREARFHVRDQLWYETLAIQILNVIEEHELSD